MKHPFSINFETLKQYDFSKTSFDEVLFFEWLIIKRTSFGNETFFYKQEQLSKETGVKRRRLERLKSDFIDNYTLVVENGGRNNITTFSVSNVFVKKFINANAKKEFKKDLIKNILSFKFKNDQIIINNDFIEHAIEMLTNIYNEERSKIKREDGSPKYPETELPFNKKTKLQFSKLLEKYDFETVKHSFKAYAFYLAKGRNENNEKFESQHVLNNFSSFNEENESFGMFERYLEQFNNKWSFT